MKTPTSPDSLPTSPPQDAQSTSPLFKLRPANDGDKPFLLNSWLRSYWESSPFTRGVLKETFFKNHHDLASATLANAHTLVAVPVEGPEDVILGWACADSLPGCGLLVHYVYVKEAFRRLGVARSLVEAFKIDGEPPTFVKGSHLTAKVEHVGLWDYDPYLLFHSVRKPK